MSSHQQVLVLDYNSQFQQIQHKLKRVLLDNDVKFEINPKTGLYEALIRLYGIAESALTFTSIPPQQKQHIKDLLNDMNNQIISNSSSANNLQALSNMTPGIINQNQTQINQQLLNQIKQQADAESQASSSKQMMSSRSPKAIRQSKTKYSSKSPQRASQKGSVSQSMTFSFQPKNQDQGLNDSHILTTSQYSNEKNTSKSISPRNIGKNSVRQSMQKQISSQQKGNRSKKNSESKVFQSQRYAKNVQNNDDEDYEDQGQTIEDLLHLQKQKLNEKQDIEELIHIQALMDKQFEKEKEKENEMQKNTKIQSIKTTKSAYHRSPEANIQKKLTKSAVQKRQTQTAKESSIIKGSSSPSRKSQIQPEDIVRERAISPSISEISSENLQLAITDIKRKLQKYQHLYLRHLQHKGTECKSPTNLTKSQNLTKSVVMNRSKSPSKLISPKKSVSGFSKQTDADFAQTNANDKGGLKQSKIIKDADSRKGSTVTGKLLRSTSASQKTKQATSKLDEQKHIAEESDEYSVADSSSQHKKNQQTPNFKDGAQNQKGFKSARNPARESQQLNISNTPKKKSSKDLKVKTERTPSPNDQHSDSKSKKKQNMEADQYAEMESPKKRPRSSRSQQRNSNLQFFGGSDKKVGFLQTPEKEKNIRRSMQLNEPGKSKETNFTLHRMSLSQQKTQKQQQQEEKKAADSIGTDKASSPVKIPNINVHSAADETAKFGNQLLQPSSQSNTHKYSLAVDSHQQTQTNSVGSQKKFSLANQKLAEQKSERSKSQKNFLNDSDYLVDASVQDSSVNQLNASSLEAQAQRAMWEILQDDQKMHYYSTEELVYYYQFVLKKAKNLYIHYLQDKNKKNKANP